MFDSRVTHALQRATEDQIAAFMEYVVICARHARSSTIRLRDIRRAMDLRAIQGGGESNFSFVNSESFM